MSIWKRIPPFILALSFVCGVESTAMSQPSRSPCEDVRGVPTDLVAFAYLDTADLKIELGGGRMYMTRQGRRSQPTVVVRNNTGKPIRWISLSFVRLGGGASKGPQIEFDRPLENGVAVRVGSACPDAQPFTKEELATLDIRDDKLVTVVVVGIDEVGFSDGRTVKIDQTERVWNFSDRLFLDD